MNRRFGKTLVELMVVVSLLGVLMATTATTLVATFHTERQIRRDLDQQTTLARLASRFRADCHVAKSVQVDQTCELAAPDGRTIRYSAVGSTIERLVMRSDKVEHRDAFRLPAGAVVKIDTPAKQNGRLVRLTIQAGDGPAKPYAPAIRPATVEAAVGIGASQGVQP